MDEESESVASERPYISPPGKPKTRSQSYGNLHGKKFEKFFFEKFHQGTCVRAEQIRGQDGRDGVFWLVRYDDGDEEHIPEAEVIDLVEKTKKRKQRFQDYEPPPKKQRRQVKKKRVQAPKSPRRNYSTRGGASKAGGNTLLDKLVDLKVRREFPVDGFMQAFEGQVISADVVNNKAFYLVRYDDGDQEHLDRLSVLNYAAEYEKYHPNYGLSKKGGRPKAAPKAKKGPKRNSNRAYSAYDDHFSHPAHSNSYDSFQSASSGAHSANPFGVTDSANPFGVSERSYGGGMSSSFASGSRQPPAQQLSRRGNTYNSSFGGGSQYRDASSEYEDFPPSPDETFDDDDDDEVYPVRGRKPRVGRRGSASSKGSKGSTRRKPNTSKVVPAQSVASEPLSFQTSDLERDFAASNVAESSLPQSRRNSLVPPELAPHIGGSPPPGVRAPSMSPSRDPFAAPSRQETDPFETVNNDDMDVKYDAPIGLVAPPSSDFPFAKPPSTFAAANKTNATVPDDGWGFASSPSPVPGSQAGSRLPSPAKEQISSRVSPDRDRSNSAFNTAEESPSPPQRSKSRSKSRSPTRNAEQSDKLNSASKAVEMDADKSGGKVDDAKVADSAQVVEDEIDEDETFSLRPRRRKGASREATQNDASAEPGGKDTSQDAKMRSPRNSVKGSPRNSTKGSPRNAKTASPPVPKTNSEKPTSPPKSAPSPKPTLRIIKPGDKGYQDMWCESSSEDERPPAKPPFRNQTAKPTGTSAAPSTAPPPVKSSPPPVKTAPAQPSTPAAAAERVFSAPAQPVPDQPAPDVSAGTSTEPGTDTIGALATDALISTTGMRLAPKGTFKPTDMIGRVVEKFFETDEDGDQPAGVAAFFGYVTAQRMLSDVLHFRVRYEDGDNEDLNLDELESILTFERKPLELIKAILPPDESTPISGAASLPNQTPHFFDMPIDTPPHHSNQTTASKANGTTPVNTATTTAADVAKPALVQPPTAPKLGQDPLFASKPVSPPRPASSSAQPSPQLSAQGSPALPAQAVAQPSFTDQQYADAAHGQPGLLGISPTNANVTTTATQSYAGWQGYPAQDYTGRSEDQAQRGASRYVPFWQKAKSGDATAQNSSGGAAAGGAGPNQPQ